MTWKEEKEFYMSASANSLAVQGVLLGLDAAADALIAEIDTAVSNLSSIPNDPLAQSAIAGLRSALVAAKGPVHDLGYAYAEANGIV